MLYGRLSGPLFKEENTPSHGKEKEEEEDAVLTVFCHPTPNFFCSDNPSVQLPCHDLGDSGSVPTISNHGWDMHEKTSLERRTRSQRFSQWIWLGYGVMLLLWSNKVWILLAEFLRFSRGKGKRQNCLVARWRSWETHEFLETALAAWPNGLSARERVGDGT